MFHSILVFSIIMFAIFIISMVSVFRNIFETIENLSRQLKLLREDTNNLESIFNRNIYDIKYDLDKFKIDLKYKFDEFKIGLESLKKEVKSFDDYKFSISKSFAEKFNELSENIDTSKQDIDSIKERILTFNSRIDSFNQAVNMLNTDSLNNTEDISDLLIKIKKIEDFFNKFKEF